MKERGTISPSAVCTGQPPRNKIKRRRRNKRKEINRKCASLMLIVSESVRFCLLAWLWSGHCSAQLSSRPEDCRFCLRMISLEAAKTVLTFSTSVAAQTR